MLKEKGQMPLAVQFQPPPASFDNFVEGRNSPALVHIQEAVEGDLPTVPTYIWGESGAGKTHLLQAAKLNLEARGMAVGWLDANTQDSADNTAFNPNWKVIILDNVDCFNAAQQHTAFNWFVNALSPTDGIVRWVLAAGRMPAADLPLREDVRTRLGWGATFALHHLSDAETRSALQHTANELGLVLSKEVVDYIQNHFARDMGSLTALLKQLDYYALKKKRAATIALIKQMLDDTHHDT